MMEQSFALYLLILLFLTFNVTRLFGVVLIALYVYRYPLVAMMVAMTAVLVGYWLMKWRSKQQRPRGRRALR